MEIGARGKGRGRGGDDAPRTHLQEARMRKGDRRGGVGRGGERFSSYYWRLNLWHSNFCIQSWLPSP